MWLREIKTVDCFECLNLKISLKGFPSGSEGKASACNAGDLGLYIFLGSVISHGEREYK